MPGASSSTCSSGEGPPPSVPSAHPPFPRSHLSRWLALRSPFASSDARAPGPHRARCVRPAPLYAPDSLPTRNVACNLNPTSSARTSSGFHANTPRPRLLPPRSVPASPTRRPDVLLSGGPWAVCSLNPPFLLTGFRAPLMHLSGYSPKTSLDEEGRGNYFRLAVPHLSSLGTPPVWEFFPF